MASSTLRRMLAGVVLYLCAASAPAVEGDRRTESLPASTSLDKPLAVSFDKPVNLRGTLGDARVQVHLRPKADIADGWEGSYFLFGRSATILLAGELDGGELALEESENGTDVSGQWNGRLDGDTITGEWLSADGAIAKPFSVKIVPAAAKATKRPGNRPQ